ncbi:hypothetical protein R1flu_024188 [Riccia fluitans]|uniref:Uncharacterized protein n=1 Tax=Riccia fluitans TaxID=41844 RepID=A0ABD1XX35_9MARC
MDISGVLHPNRVSFPATWDCSAGWHLGATKCTSPACILGCNYALNVKARWGYGSEHSLGAERSVIRVVLLVKQCSKKSGEVDTEKSSSRERSLVEVELVEDKASKKEERDVEVCGGRSCGVLPW